MVTVSTLASCPCSHLLTYLSLPRSQPNLGPPVDVGGGGVAGTVGGQGVPGSPHPLHLRCLPQAQRHQTREVEASAAHAAAGELRGTGRGVLLALWGSGGSECERCWNGLQVASVPA